MDALERLGIWFVVFLFASQPIVLAPNSTTTGVIRPALERWGFYVTYDATSRSSLLAHLDQLDVVVPDYFSLQPTGAIAGQVDDAIDPVVVRAGKKLLPLVQSRVSFGDLSPFLDDPGRRANVVATLIGLVVAHGFAGITLDFEGVSPSDRAALSALVSELASALHSRGRLLAVAVPANSGTPAGLWPAGFDETAIGAVADRVVVMAYPYRTASSTHPGPVAPLPWVADVTAYAVAHIPRERLILGIDLWGYDWTVGATSPATLLRYDQTAALMAHTNGEFRFDATNAAAFYSYQANAEVHQVWFENAGSVQGRISLATTNHLAGIALWRLGQEDPGVWNDLRVGGQADFAVAHGWFFEETGGDDGLGYAVLDDDARFWSEFQRLGGIATLGFPSSRRYVGADGFTYQDFQRGVLQWRPERGEAVLANVFEQLTLAGQDSYLAEQGIPPPIADDGSHGDWNLARQIRLSWLTEPRIASAYFANPNPTAISAWDAESSIQLYGLPMSRPVRSGPFIVQRFQRVSLQLWVDDVPGMPRPGRVVGVLGGDLLKRAGVVPTFAAVPEAPF